MERDRGLEGIKRGREKCERGKEEGIEREIGEKDRER